MGRSPEEVWKVAAQSTSDSPPATDNLDEARSGSRRRFLKRAGAAIALLAPASLAGSAFRAVAVGAPGDLTTTKRGELREKFLAQANAAVREAHLGTGPGELPEATLAEIADPSGLRSEKLQATVSADTRRKVGMAPATVILSDENILVRMQKDLQRALEKPVEQRRWAMAIDLRKCIGCSACTVACKAENKLPPGVVYRPVVEQEVGSYPNVSRRFTPRPCMQCDNPPCVPVCPVGATYKRPDGIVAIDYDVCIGCRYCIAACPYGARTFDFGENYTGVTTPAQPYEREASFEYGRAWSRQNGQSPVGNVRKCQFCLHRLEEGMLPACVTTCVGGATYFGDANDPESLVSYLISRPNTMRLKEELGTQPKVHYLI